MTINADPMAIGARLPAPGSMTHIPTVRTRKNVPMNSVRYFFIGLNVRFGGSLVPHFINTTTFARGNWSVWCKGAVLKAGAPVAVTCLGEVPQFLAKRKD